MGTRTNVFHIPAPGLDIPPWGEDLGPGLWLASSEFNTLERFITC